MTIIIRRPRTRQPLEPAPVSNRWPVAYASTPGIAPARNRVNGAMPSAIAGLGITEITALGLGRRFNAFSNGYIATDLKTNPLRRTWVISFVWRDNGGATGAPRLADRAASADCIYLNAFADPAMSLELVRSYSGSRGLWSVPIATYSEVPRTVAISLDASSSSNAPVIAVGGVRQTVTTVEAPSGSALTSGTDAWYLGNRAAADRDFAGLLIGVAAIDAALPLDTVVSLSRNPWQLYAPSRVIIPYQSAAATAPTLSALSAINVTATSAQPRITYTF